MTRSRRARGRITAAVASASLIALASALATLGNVAWSAPPRYDGAGYAVLARALLSGQGYRAIDHPDRPRHAHFPPGYPLLLALTWCVGGESATTAHIASALCTIGATVAAWWWFRRLMSGRAALLLGLALAVNWLWVRTGGGIQSEPLYMLLGQLTILAEVRAGRRTRSATIDSIVLGLLLAACLLTRHIAIGLAVAALLDLALRRARRQALTALVIAAVAVFPWLAWLAAVGSGVRTQAALLLHTDRNWVQQIAGNAVFYAQRIPDQLTGPFVEVGTAFLNSPRAAAVANCWAVIATAVIIGGCFAMLRHPRLRLAGMVPLCTIAVLLVWPFTEAGRFLVPLIPCLLIAAVEGLTWLARWFMRPKVESNWRLSRCRLGAAVLLFLLSVPYSAYQLATGRARTIDASFREVAAACRWLAAQTDPPGPVLTRYPGEVFWLTGRQALQVPTAERPGGLDTSADAIAQTIMAYRVAYLLVDEKRFANEPVSPLAQFVATHPERVRAVWGGAGERGSVVIYEIRTDQSRNGPRGVFQ
jgi:hypothetical protein